MKSIIAVLISLCLLAGCGIASGTDGIQIPEIDLKSFEIPDNEALALVRDMKAGWNLGNSFDAVNCGWLSDHMEYESAWCGAKASEGLFDALAEAGFHTVRIPVSWHHHLEEDLTIKADWLERVAEVVSWAYDRGMYVIVNIHHDCAPEYYYPDSAHLESSERYMRTIWKQVAERFADFGDHLIFESINEPRLTEDSVHEWWWESGNDACRDAMQAIVYLNQVFVDTVRAAGGKNGERYLMVPSYAANPEYACSSQFTLPEDSAENRIILSAHAYTPYSFALEQPGISAFSLVYSAQKNEIAAFLQKLYTRYVRKGIPVLIGEFGAMEKNGNLQDRVDWVSWYVKSARIRGITCCWWDNNIFSGDGERFGLMDRATGECRTPELLEAFMKYCE